MFAVVIWFGFIHALMSGWDLILGPLGSGAGALLLPSLQRVDPSHAQACWKSLSGRSRQRGGVDTSLVGVSEKKKLGQISGFPERGQSML